MFTGFSSKETSKIDLEDFNDFFNFLGILETETQNQKTFKKSNILSQLLSKVSN